MSRIKNQRALVFVVADIDAAAGVDPDFDSFGGELTMAQWSDPLPPQWGELHDFEMHRQMVAHQKIVEQRKQIAEQRRQLTWVSEKLWKAMVDNLRDPRKRLQKASNRLEWLLWGHNYTWQMPGPAGQGREPIWVSK